MRKPEVRELAKQHGLALAEKPDSQEICFVPGGDYKNFIDAYLAEQNEALPDTAGELVTSTGEVVGTHHGIHNFTVGQRKGLGVATGSPLYVLQIRGDRREVCGRQWRRALLEDDARSQAELDRRRATDGADARRYKNSSSPRACARNRSA